MRLEKKVAVITGAGSGMGSAMAKLFASEGAKVICADISGKQDGSPPPSAKRRSPSIPTSPMKTISSG